MSTVAEQEEQTTEAAFIPVAHIPTRRSSRVAVCGEPILGIEATGEFTKCEDCALMYALWGR
jgi:hypothetical protein